MKISRQDARIIRKCASEQSVRDGGPARVKIEAGIRYNTEVDIEPDVNILNVTRQADTGWNDTDLHDYRAWSDLLKWDIRPDANGMVMIDFNISSIDQYGGELVTFIQGIWKDGSLKSIQVDSPNRTIWGHPE